MWVLTFVESPKIKALKYNFRGFINFVTATSPEAWHCTSDDVINIRTQSRSSLVSRACTHYQALFSPPPREPGDEARSSSQSSLLLSHTYRDLDK